MKTTSATRPGFDDSADFDEEPGIEADSAYSDEDDEDEEEYRTAESARRRPLALIIIIILILIVLGIGAFLFLRGSGSAAVPPLAADGSGVEASEPDYAEPADEEPAITAQDEPRPPEAEEPAVNNEPEVSGGTGEKQPAAEPVPEPEPEKTAVAVNSSEVPPEGRGGGVWYRLKWGDTLWNLSISFYRTPWLYGLIAVENGIKNPDLIYAGTDLFIPEN